MAGNLGANQVADQLISKHLMGPMILVMPQTYTGHAYTECLNSTRGQDATYLTTDVRHDIETHFRAARDSAQWGLVGVSSGGYCAANLTLQHPSMFGAAGVLSGYFRPQDGPAAQILNYDPTAEAANDPLLLARRINAGAAPLPSYWLSAGTGDRGDYQGAQAFIAALHGVDKVTFYRVAGGQHTFYAFAPALNRVLPWAWTQLASPQQRVQFPIAGGVTSHSVTVAPKEYVKHRTALAIVNGTAPPAPRPSATTHRTDTEHQHASHKHRRHPVAIVRRGERRTVATGHPDRRR